MSKQLLAHKHIHRMRGKPRSAEMHMVWCKSAQGVSSTNWIQNKHQQYTETIISQHFVVCIGALLFVLSYKNGVTGHGGTNASSSGYSLQTNHQWDTSTRQIHQLIPCCNMSICIYICIYIYIMYVIYYYIQCATTWNAFRFGIIWHTWIPQCHVSIESLAEVWDFSCCHIALLSNRAAFLSGWFGRSNRCDSESALRFRNHMYSVHCHLCTSTRQS